MTPEGKVKAAVKRWLKARDWWFYMPVQNGMGVSGIHDFIVCERVVITPDMVGQVVGRFRTIETKADKRSRVTENQHARAAEIQAAGGLCVVCTDVSQLDQEWTWPTPEDPSEPRTKRHTTPSPKT